MRYILLVVVVFMVMVDQTEGLKCVPCDYVKCQKPKGCRRRFYVKEICGCCDVCGTKFGQPCSASTPRCARNMWCIKRDGNSIEAKRNVAWPDTFTGVCGRIRVPRQTQCETTVESSTTKTELLLTQPVENNPPERLFGK
uniref:Insulin-like growth factor binding protein-4 n=1 Tax=Haliotis diversicolor TaxID=36095 RepID=K9UTR7_HALDV|nr:insulin-like growth factor binding protein-4 [Haliotis diversicolor]